MGRWVLWLAPCLLLPLLIYWYWPRPREVVYSLYRQHGRNQTLSTLSGYQTKATEHFQILYTPADENVVDMILQTAESVYQPVVDQVGYEPAGKVPLIVYPTRDDLRSAFDWGSSESALGVYWSGTIRLLSPNVWIPSVTESERYRVFAQLNPLAHELTHYVLDYYTNGNYPRWFTEGLAQWVEYNTTGYLWLEPESTLRQRLYTLEDLTRRFDEVGNQPLAYRQSFLLVDYIAQTYGEHRLFELVQELGRGVPFSRAVHMVTRDTQEQIYDHWLHWVSDHLDALESAG